MTNTNQVPGRALTYGHDAVLLATRAKLLEADGYVTDIAANFLELRRLLVQYPAYDIVVLCHTVSQVESEQVQSALQRLGKPLFVMTRLMAPDEFLREVARLTGKHSSPAES